MPSSPPLTVMTWNVRYFGHALRGLLATRRGMNRAAQALASLVPLPDVVALQEVETRSLRAGLHRTPQLERFLAQLHATLARAGRQERYASFYYPAHTYRLRRGAPALYTTGLALLVRDDLDVIDHNAEDPHDITHVRVPLFAGVKQKRIAAHLRVRPRDGGSPVDIFNTHLSLPAFLEVGPHRIHERMGHGSNQLAEIQTLLAFVDERRDDHAVIVGDFNTLPHSPAYQAILDAGFHDAFAHANALAPHDLHAHPTAGFGRARMHIDHVFATEGLDWEGVEGFAYGDPHDFHGLSDHTPKIGRLVLPG